jgi:L-aminopeptidase/D-esterase-like protein
MPLFQRLTDVPGVAVGHWSNELARTGCTVVLLPEGSVASGEVRGGAPGTREFELLEPSRMVQHIDAVVLSGGSAFGLGVADGVMRWVEEEGRGYATPHARVPIVPAMVIYDLGVGRADVRPGAEQGYLACSAASRAGHHVGRVGAGTGATRSKWRGVDAQLESGLGAATVSSGDLIVSALMVVNPMGDVSNGEPPSDVSLEAVVTHFEARSTPFMGRTNTTIGVIATNAILDKRECFLLAQSGHDGIARAIWPSHLQGDGDATVAVSVSSDRSVKVPIDAVRALAIEAVARAIRSVLRRDTASQ